MNSEHKTHLGLSGIQEISSIPEEEEALGLIKKPFLKKKKHVEEAMAAATSTKKSEEENITSLKVEVIDDTALILQALVPIPKSHLGPHAPSSSRRRRRNQQGIKEEKKKKKKQHVRKKQKETIKYSRAELEALRFVNCGGQKRLWEKVYRGIGSVVAKEYDDLAISNCCMKKMDQSPLPPALLGVGAARGRLNQMNVFVH